MRSLAALLAGCAALGASLAGCVPDGPTDLFPDGDALTTAHTTGRSETTRPDADPLSPDSLAGTFEGYYARGFEHSGFRPCADTTETWWTEPAMTFHPVGRDQYRAEMAPGADINAAYRPFAGPRRPVLNGPAVWARLRGRTSPRGGRGYGHMGLYTREFAVDSVEAMAAEPPAGACARLSSTYPTNPPR